MRKRMDGETEIMLAVGFHRSLPISDPDSLLDVELADPEPQENDLLVEIEAISVNPADAKAENSNRSGSAA